MELAEAPSAVLFDETKNHRLSEIYSPCFALVLQLRATSAFGEADLLRERIKRLLDKAGVEAARAGVAHEDVQAAKFAMVAFIDETILSSEWAEKDRWLARPLQLEIYDRYDAGEEFFVKLETLRGQRVHRAEVLEVYYLCMALGFKGRYQLHDQERLRLIIEETYAELKRAPGMGVGVLSVHGKPRDQVATEVKSKLPAWMVVAAAAILGLIMYLGMSFYISSTAQDAARIIDEVPRTESVR
jgi:type VI secretion system protein ImpK